MKAVSYIKLADDNPSFDTPSSTERKQLFFRG